MATVTITLTDTDDKTVESNMIIEGYESGSDLELTSAVIFGETIMRALPGDGMWGLAKSLVPEAFEEEE
tara:strand:- start:210413 stop:210619 length:207 start_codon:yes stop_codon:yes gene_type:complete